MRQLRAAKADTNLQKAGLLIVFVTVIAALYFGSGLFIPLALALLFTFVLAPLADWMEDRGLHRAFAAVLVVFVMCTLTLGLAYVVGDQLVRFAQDLPKYQGEINRKIRIFKGSGGGAMEEFSKSLGKIGDVAAAGGTEGDRPDPSTQTTTAPAKNLTQAAGNQIVAAGESLKIAPSTQPAALGGSEKNPVYVIDASQTTSPLNNLTLYLSYAAGPLGIIGLVLVLVLFMLLERDQLRDRFIRLTSGGRYTVTTQAIGDAATRVGRYLRALLIVNGTYGVAIATGLWIISATLGGGITFPSFILWGVLCAVLRFIPYVGPWVAAAFPIAVSLAVYPGFGVFFAVLAMFVVIELLSNNIMEPILYGSSTGLSTVALLVAAIFWTLLWGPYGLLLSTPLTVCLVVLGKHVPHLSFLDVILGDTPALPASDRFYQRLIAGDARDAGNVATEYAEQHGTIAAADEVVIRAIRLARHDRHADELTATEEIAIYQVADEILKRPRTAEKEAKKSKDEFPNEVTDAGADLKKPLVIGLPSHHRSETIAVDLVASLLEPIGARVEGFSCSLLPTDVEEQVEEQRPAAIFIAVMPPGGSTQARYLCRRLRRKFKTLPIIVGYFGTYRDYDALLVRFRASGASYVTTTVGQARTQLASLLNLKISPEVERIQFGPPDEERAMKARADAAQPNALCAGPTAEAGR